jgi:hypothetical protein
MLFGSRDWHFLFNNFDFETAVAAALGGGMVNSSA